MRILVIQQIHDYHQTVSTVDSSQLNHENPVDAVLIKGLEANKDETNFSVCYYPRAVGDEDDGHCVGAADRNFTLPTVIDKVVFVNVIYE